MLHVLSITMIESVGCHACTVIKFDKYLVHLQDHMVYTHNIICCKPCGPGGVYDMYNNYVALIFQNSFAQSNSLLKITKKFSSF